MASNPFRSGVRPWTRITNAARAAALGALGAGELAVTETGKVVAGNGTTPLSNLSPLLTEAGALAGYVTFDGTNLRLAGAVIPISGGGGSAEIGFDTDGVPYILGGAPTPSVVVQSSTGGILTLTGSGVTEQGGIITMTGTNVTEQNGVITIS